MSRRPALFTQADIHRAIRAMKQSGVPVIKVVAMPDGTFEIRPHEATKTPPVEADHEIVLW